MKFTFQTASLLTAIWFSTANAFPFMLFEVAKREGLDANQLYARIAAPDASESDASLRTRVLGASPGFNAAAQRVSVSGKNAFVPPGPGDIRGPCPGLNALANHNYIPHNGVPTISQAVDGTTKVFGMGNDLAGFLSIYGSAIDGDLTSFSIGGPPPGGPPLGLLGKPQGLSGSHNKYETDASPTRGDLYSTGDNSKVVLAQFEDLFSRQPDPATANYDLPVLTKFRADRRANSVATNPYYFSGAFSGVLVEPAAYTFIYRFMANKSAEAPEGRLNQEVLKSFFSVTGNPGSFKYTPGNERIPENWYRRAFGDEYTIPFFLLDTLAAAQTYPQFISVGGNTGTVNSFTGVDLANLTGGVYNTQSLLQGNNLGCFAIQVAQAAIPDILGGLFSNLQAALAQVNSALNNALAPLSCPQLPIVRQEAFNKFPGYTMSK